MLLGAILCYPIFDSADTLANGQLSWLRLLSLKIIIILWDPVLATISALAPMPDRERYMKFFRPHRFMTKIAIIVKTILITEKEF